jgi:hypothetical protein
VIMRSNVRVSMRTSSCSGSTALKLLINPFDVGFNLIQAPYLVLRGVLTPQNSPWSLLARWSRRSRRDLGSNLSELRHMGGFWNCY